jgi:hypothetical protein
MKFTEGHFCRPALGGAECFSIALLSRAMEKNTNLCGLCASSGAGGEYLVAHAYIIDS